MTYKLAEKNQLQDVSWIKPGQVSWEWWNDASPYGPDVNFVSGYNLDTYKYYIDLLLNLVFHISLWMKAGLKVRVILIRLILKLTCTS